jgi:hypothetical protein
MNGTLMSKKTKKSVLSGYQRKGKILTPPMMQLPNLVETSFIDSKIPELIWISALFNWTDDRSAVNSVIEFQVTAPDQMPSLSFLSNFDKLSNAQKNAILSDSKCFQWIEKLRKALWHQHYLLEHYPLAFIFEAGGDFDREDAIVRLKEDVQDLFDRHSHHATKVQTTAVVAMMTFLTPIEFLMPPTLLMLARLLHLFVPPLMQEATWTRMQRSRLSGLMNSGLNLIS